jgi:hypothetical protein
MMGWTENYRLAGPDVLLRGKNMYIHLSLGKMPGTKTMRLSPPLLEKEDRQRI